MGIHPGLFYLIYNIAPTVAILALIPLRWWAVKYLSGYLIWEATRWWSIHIYHVQAGLAFWVAKTMLGGGSSPAVHAMHMCSSSKSSPSCPFPGCPSGLLHLCQHISQLSPFVIRTGQKFPQLFLHAGKNPTPLGPGTYVLAHAPVLAGGAL